MENLNTNLAGQFIASRRPVEVEGWNVRRRNGWYLSAHPAVGIFELPSGWLIGRPTWGGKFVKDYYSDDLYNLGGPWVALLFEEKRLYMDAFGYQSVVYGHGCIATNPLLIPEAEPHQERKAQIVDAAQKADANIWHPFGLTSFKRINRLLPNHYLSLTSWKQVRHWPSNPVSEITVTEAASVVSRVIKDNIRAIRESHYLQSNLTAGLDTRMLLSCMRSFTREVYFFTHDLHPYTGKLDVKAAKELSKRHGLSHSLFVTYEKSRLELEQYLKQTGYSRAGMVHCKYTWSVPNSLPSKGMRVNGLAGGILKGIYYANKKPNTLTPEYIIRRLGLRATQDILNAAKAWVENLPTKNPETIFDLLYVEQRLGTWDAPQHYGGDNPMRNFMPLCHRDVSEVMLGLPKSAKDLAAVHYEVIKTEWPELLDIPVNADWGFSSTLSKFKGLMGKITKKVAIRTRIKNMLE